ncbi:hypothetical protein LJB88_03375 [Erysipelotrichaceae bacterium OttesenSCG-928-M19]|nr:hypothetical protein [Erysipelotrichaceae bacterium OttesenSCG-928-M19]
MNAYIEINAMKNELFSSSSLKAIFPILLPVGKKLVTNYINSEGDYITEAFDSDNIVNYLEECGYVTVNLIEDDSYGVEILRLTDYADIISNVKLLMSYSLFKNNYTEIMKAFDQWFLDDDINYLTIDYQDYFNKYVCGFEESYLNIYDYKNINFSNYVFDVSYLDTNKIKVVGNDIIDYIEQDNLFYKIEVDMEYLVGHEHRLNEKVVLGCSQIMWFSKKYAEFLDFEVLKNYDNCYQNRIIAQDVYCIQLYRDLADYENKDKLEVMQNFRIALKIDEIAHQHEGISYPVPSIEELKKNKETIVVDSSSSLELERQRIYDLIANLKIRKMPLFTKNRELILQYNALVDDIQLAFSNRYNPYENNSYAKYNEIYSKVYALEGLDYIEDKFGFIIDQTERFEQEFTMVLNKLKDYFITNGIDSEEMKKNFLNISLRLGSLLSVLLVNRAEYYLKWCDLDLEKTLR